MPIEIDPVRFRLPAAVAARLRTLLDIQDDGQNLTSEERGEAEGLIDLAELLTLPRLRAERASRGVEGVSDASRIARTRTGMA